VCANLYFPFRSDEASRAILAAFLQSYVSPDIAVVEGVELEYQCPGDLCPEALLGEAGGQRGSGQTSPDVAFLVKTRSGKSGVVLTECKFTEHSFYACSGRTKGDDDEYPKNPDPARCHAPITVLENPSKQCHFTSWGRRYWDHLKPAANSSAFNALTRCPAATAGYQLLRQQSLAEGVAASGRYDLVVSCVAFDDRNKDLIECLRSTGIMDFRTGWGSLFAGKAKFATFTHQQWVRWVRDHDDPGRWRRWLNYVHERYGY
jgi:hypothetical protein